MTRDLVLYFLPDDSRRHDCATRPANHPPASKGEVDNQ